MSVNSNISTQNFTCQYCDREHESLRALRIHEAWHRRDDTSSKLFPRGKFACPWCDVTTDHGRGLSQHTKKTHGIGGKELYAVRFPQCRTTCVDCGTPTLFKDQEAGYPERCPKCSRRHSYTTKNITSWNKGLTKETDERMAASATNMREHYATSGHHNTGKTKENDEHIRLKATKISSKLNEYYATHEGWSKGLTKETSQIIAKRSQQISIALKGRILEDETLEKMRKAKLLSHDVIQTRLKNYQLELISEYVDTVTKSEIKCTQCNSVFSRSVGAVFNNSAKCPKCYPPWADKTSKWQKEIHAFVSLISIDAILDDRLVLGGKELDIYVPSQSFAIECNGLYWHSESPNRFDPDHTEKKRILAKSAGVNLLTIFEDEWRDKRSIIESMIKHRLGLSTTIGARKLTTQRCAPSEISDLLDEWHLEGHVNSSYALKMVTKAGNIIGACSLRWARGTGKNTLEIARIAFYPGIHVSGGISKFIAEAYRWGKELGSQKLLSYSDNRLGNGSGYLASGMKLDGLTVSRFWWTDFCERYDRFKYRADRTRNLTERQVAKDAGVVRIYGCSNSRWTLDISKPAA